MKMGKQEEILIKFEEFSDKTEKNSFFTALITPFFNKNIKPLINCHCLKDFFIKSRYFNKLLFSGHKSELSIAYSSAHNLNLLYQSTKI